MQHSPRTPHGAVVENLNPATDAVLTVENLDRPDPSGAALFYVCVRTLPAADGASVASHTE
ncbi:hypothetical protein K4B79_14485 [Streptomyces lincolnensis]|uniref:hypothetical protein n=1 Tax=Streptomyces lincolnensis TaxID=1915 RepID=UPI001E372C54|nr:hypothetical protein [Streptomyces lincolnensis]MCD7439435.1 hypothetical protein [Streptomyces lincolnensis]